MKTVTRACVLLLAILFSTATLGDDDFDLSSIDFGDLENATSRDAYGDGTPVPYSGPALTNALNEALGLETDTPSSQTMSTLLQAEQQAEANAIKANNYADVVADSFTQTGATSIQTASSLASATYAAGVQKFLIDFASALADLASVSDFFEGLAKGDMKDNTLLQNLDSIYEMAKDGESAVNNLTQNMGTTLGVEGAEGPSLVNDPFGTVGTADQFWGTDGLTNINSLKSDFSDIANMIDDYRGGKPLNGRTLGQLIIRIGKGFAENDLKEREQQIKNLTRDLAAEQTTMGGLAAQLQAANNAKWEAMDALKALREAIAALTQADPASLGGSGTGAGATGSGAATSPIVLATVKCPECQPLADQINQARRAMHNIQQRIAAIEAEQRSLETKKARLQHLKDALAGFDRVTAGAREGLRSTDVPVLGPSQEIQNDINLRNMDRMKAVNEIGRLEREIEIEEGDDPAAELARLRKASSELRESLRDLRYQLSQCDQEPCKQPIATGDPSLAALGALLVGDASLSQGGVTEGPAPESVLGDLSRPLQKISTNCTACQWIVDIYNQTVDRIRELQAALEQAVDKENRARQEFSDAARWVAELSFPSSPPPDSDLARQGVKHVVSYDGGHGARGKSYFQNDSQLELARRSAIEARNAAQQALTAAAEATKKARQERDAAYETLSRAVVSLITCEKQCASVRLLNAINLFGNNPFDRQDPLNGENQQNQNQNNFNNILVLPFMSTFIPVNRMSLAGPDACPLSHFHGGSAMGCDGVVYSDPLPGVCGFGVVTNVISIPISSCAHP